MTQPLLRPTDVESDVVNRLRRLLDDERPELEEYDRLYEGTQRANYMHEEIFAESGDRIPQVRIFWPQVAVDAIVERLFVQGIKTGDEDLDKEFHRVWAFNEMDLGFTQAITDALVMRRAGISIGTNEDDKATPIVCPESPLELYVRDDPRTRKPVEGLRVWCAYDNTGLMSEEYATVYLPNSTTWLERGRGGWVVNRRDDHNLGELPVAVLVNRPRTSAAQSGPARYRRERVGRSDIEPIRTLSWSGNKFATDMGVAGERVAIPLRALFGAGPEDFKDQSGNQMTPMQALQANLLAIPESDVKAFEFTAAQLSNFTTALREISQQVGMSTGLPPHYLGTPSDNPASAEAITGSESRLATRAELKQLPFGAAVRRAAWLMHRFATGEWSDEIRTAKVDWRNVRTPTVGAMADAAVKLYSTQPTPIIPLHQTREALGYSDDEIAEMEEQDELAAAREPTSRLAGALVDQRVTGGGQ